MQCRPVTSHHPWPNPTHGTPDGAQKRATRPSEPQGAAEAWAAGARPPGTPLQTSSGAAPATPPRAAQAAAGGKVRPRHRHSQLQRRSRPPRRPPRRYLPLPAYPPALQRAQRPPRCHPNHPAAADAPAAPPRAPLPRSSGHVGRSRRRRLLRSPPGCERRQPERSAYSARAHERPSRRAPVPYRPRARSSRCVVATRRPCSPACSPSATPTAVWRSMKHWRATR